MRYRTFSIGVKDDGNLEFLESQFELPVDTGLAEQDLIEAMNWDRVIAVGMMTIRDGLEDKWWVFTKASYEAREQNRRDEALQALMGN